MTVSINRLTNVISVPQSDLTLVGGTLYDVDTNALRLAIKRDIEYSEDGIVEDDVLLHNGETTVAGVTYARGISVINSNKLQFTPDVQWTARLVGSNNNFFDVQNGVLVQNQVQVIPTNSAGLQTVTQGSGVTEQDKTDIITGVFNHQYEGTETFAQYLRLSRAVLWGKVVAVSDTVFEFWDRIGPLLGKKRLTVTVDKETEERTNVVIEDAD